MILNSVDYQLGKYDKPTTMLFKCTECSCRQFYRRKIDYGHCFFVGSHFCLNCKTEHNYASDAFYRKETAVTIPPPAPVQLALFT
jgi:hypothetical protein